MIIYCVNFRLKIASIKSNDQSLSSVGPYEPDLWLICLGAINIHDLIIINKNSLSNNDEQIRHEIASVTLMMNNHEKKISLNIVRMINHDIILKTFWLRHHNSFINWTKKQFKFERCSCVITDQFTHRQQTMMNEKQNIKYIAKRKIAVLIKNDDDWFDLSNIRRNRSNQRNKITKKNLRIFEKSRKHWHDAEIIKKQNVKCL